MNHDGAGALRGLAYGANIGWINFHGTGNPRVDLGTGRLSGYAWSANCGWINLGDANFAVQTDTIAPGADSDGDGITDAWELSETGDLTTLTVTGDLDGDGESDVAEYLTDTDPADPTAGLRIIHFFTADSGATTDITWTSRLTRRYQIDTKLSLLDAWEPAVLEIVPDPGESTALTLEDTAALCRFYRIRATRPLAP